MRMTETFGPLLPVDTRDLSAAGRVQMLDLTFARHRLGISVMPFVAGPLVWFLSKLQDATWLAVWAGFFFLFSLAMLVIGQRFASDLKTLDPEWLLRKWQPRIEHIALLNGAGLSASVVLTAGRAPYEFELLLFAVGADSNLTRRAD